MPDQDYEAHEAQVQPSPGGATATLSAEFQAPDRSEPAGTVGSSGFLSTFVVVAGLGCSLLWSFWPTLTELSETWGSDPKYTYGYLVPAFAAVLLWLRRDQLGGARLIWNWWGVPIVAAGSALNVLGSYFYLDPTSGVGLIVSVAGMLVLAGSWPLLRWAWPAWAFLFLMLPLPYRLEVALAHPLQRIATRTSTYALQTVGVPALAEGNVIVLPDARIGVVEACSGLSMMMLFVAMATAVILVTRRAWWEKILILLSAAPIAVFANVVRISATCILQETLGSTIAHAVYHDLAGWLMMPFALSVLLLELLFLQRLWITVELTEPAPLAVAVRGGLPPTTGEEVPQLRRQRPRR